MRFHTTLLQSGKTAVGIQVPNEVVAALGAGKRPPVVARADAQVRRHALIRSLQLLLRRLADQASIIVVLEDVHWMDAASAEVLSEILIDPAHAPSVGVGRATSWLDSTLE